MIYTGLPYDLSKMEEISENGATVDLSDINFPFVKDQIATTFVFLRNTNFNNIKLDLSKCDYTRKVELLKEYMTTKMDVELGELVRIWYNILIYHIMKRNVMPDMFTDDELNNFINSNEGLIIELESILHSCPLALMVEQLKEGNPYLNVMPIAVGVNFKYLLKIENIDAVIFGVEMPLVYYRDIFDDELFKWRLKKSESLVPSILYSLIEMPEVAFKEILDGNINESGLADEFQPKTIS